MNGARMVDKLLLAAAGLVILAGCSSSGGSSPSTSTTGDGGVRQTSTTAVVSSSDPNSSGPVTARIDSVDRNLTGLARYANGGVEVTLTVANNGTATEPIFDPDFRIQPGDQADVQATTGPIHADTSEPYRGCDFGAVTLEPGSHAQIELCFPAQDTNLNTSLTLVWHARRHQDQVSRIPLT